MAEYFTSFFLEAYLSGIWADLSNDWLSNKVTNCEWGINGNAPLDILPDTGQMKFVLKNVDGKYNPDGTSPLAGWGFGVPVRLTFVYNSTSYIRFLGYVDRIDLQTGDTQAHDRVQITALDWIKYADSHPILAPEILENKRADEGIQTILTSMPRPPAAVQLQTGNNIFPVIFDGVGLRTTAYTEFAKLVQSEFGTLALLKDAATGEKLKFFNYSSNSAGAVSAHINSDIDDVSLNYGHNVINRGVATAYPKKIDKELKVLYKLSKPMPIKAGETITFRAKYTDPEGGSRVNAIVSSMQIPEVPGAVDPYLMTLLNFTDDMNVIDETGRHTWTMGTNQMLWNDVYADGYGRTFSNGILGSYMVFGGYPNYKLTAPSSADFNFGSGAFTIGWYEDKFNPSDGNNTMARDNTSKPPFILGAPFNNGKENNVVFYSGGVRGTGGPPEPPYTFDDIHNVGVKKSLGQVNVGRWTYYEFSRDEDGWFYCFSDGKLIDTWYSAEAIRDSTGAFTIGNTQGSKWSYMALDSFFIKKGICMHKSDFERPLRKMRPVLDGDYLLNTMENGAGTDLSASLGITASYGSEAVTYTLINNSSQDGFIIHLQARGRGVYAYNSIENSYTDTASAESDIGYKEINLDQKYQTDTKFGTVVVTDIVNQEKAPRTQLESISFFANKTTATMNNFLQRDIHDVIHVTDTAHGIDNFFFIQKVSFDLRAGGIVYVTWDLKSALAIDAIHPPPVPPNFQGIISIGSGTNGSGGGITQTQTIDIVILNPGAGNAVPITITDITQKQTMDATVAAQGFSAGGVVSDSSSSIDGDFVFWSGTDGKHIIDSGLGMRDVAARGEIYYLDNTSSDITGYKSLIKDYATIVSGTASASINTSTPTIIEEFITSALDIPYLFKSPFLPIVWLSSDVDESFDVTLDIYLRDTGDTETVLCSVSVLNQALTETPSKIDPGVLLRLVGDTIIDPTDRIVFKVIAQAISSTANVTVHYGDDASPSILCVPNYAPPLAVVTPVDNATNWQAPFVFDDFVSVSYYSGISIAPGDLGWMVAVPDDFEIVPSITASPNMHPGVVEIWKTTGGGGNNLMSIAPLYAVDMIDLMQYVGMFNAVAIANEGYAFGLMDNSGFSVDGSSEGVYFKYENGDTNWYCVTTFDGSTTAYDTGVAFAADTWFLFEIKRINADTFEFYINQTLVGTHQSDLVSAGAPQYIPVFGMSNQGTDNSAFIDYFAMQLAPIIQRWD